MLAPAVGGLEAEVLAELAVEEEVVAEPAKVVGLGGPAAAEVADASIRTG